RQGQHPADAPGRTGDQGDASGALGVHHSESPMIATIGRTTKTVLMPIDPADTPSGRLSQTATEQRPKSSCDLYAVIGRAVDNTVTSGVLMSLTLDPRLRGQRAAEAGAVAAAVRAMIGAVGAGGMVVVRAN